METFVCSAFRQWQPQQQTCGTAHANMHGRAEARTLVYCALHPALRAVVTVQSLESACTRTSDDGSHIFFWKRIAVERASFGVHPPLRSQRSFELLRDVPLELRIQETARVHASEQNSSVL